ncbi:DUF1707 domain-containing protein [Lipingzhangella sp. LS1_29]|uniref:DUF1707 domain-containing protein n=2 Tax=Lipingzhangella rawalii TaxID=2055835 RepID=A0ABU2HBD7_9ACTN|nr:DUF1707 domain-containing protein [Lipingzhangella rawalii]
MRASDTDRERVAEVVRQAAADGRITLDELQERLEAAYTARTYAELEPITVDLPSAESDTAPAVGSPASDVATSGEPALTISERLGTVRREGKWQVPGTISVSNPLGTTHLDFREATFRSRVVDVQLDATAGSAVLILPLGATATVDVTTSWGGVVRHKVAEVPDPGGTGPHLRITGKASAGTVVVRHKKSWMGWLFGDDEGW